jgi:GWxTD domain-containing protein
MKKFLLVLMFCITAFGSVKADVQAIFNYKQFYTPYGGTYIETYLSFIASSVKYKPNEKGILQSNLLVTQIVKQGQEIIDFKKYEILGPELSDSIAVGFKDQKRFMLSPGKYTLEIELLDLNSTDSIPVLTVQKIEIKFNKEEISLSDIELIDYFKKTTDKNEFSKSGFDIYPMVSNYLPTEIEKLGYYFEIYKLDELEEPFLLRHYIEKFESKEILTKYVKRERIKLNKVKPVINLFNIKDLPTGNYNLTVELIDKKNKLVTDKKVFFQRVNNNVESVLEVKNSIDFENFINQDSIEGYLKSLLPIASEMEYSIIDNKIKNMDGQKKLNFFYNFWSNRNESNPKEEWLVYKGKIREAQLRYGTSLKKGYETDRGRVFVKYGEPNTLSDNKSNAGSYPYQIWHYYRIGQVNNIVFVFYQPNLIGKDYELLHSDMKGEVQNRDWKSVVNFRVNGGNNDNRDSEIPR